MILWKSNLKVRRMSKAPMKDERIHFQNDTYMLAESVVFLKARLQLVVNINLSLFLRFVKCLIPKNYLFLKLFNRLIDLLNTLFLFYILIYTSFRHLYSQYKKVILNKILVHPINLFDFPIWLKSFLWQLTI